MGVEKKVSEIGSRLRNSKIKTKLRHEDLEEVGFQPMGSENWGLKSEKHGDMRSSGQA